MRKIIRVGDPTSHDGRVMTGYEPCRIDGRPIARVGDKCTCPWDGHDTCTIVEGDPDHLVGGVPAAFEGCRTDCGALLIASLGSYEVG